MMIKDKLIHEIRTVKMDLPNIEKYSIEALQLIKDLALVNASKDVILEVVNNVSLVNLLFENRNLYKILVETRRGKDERISKPNTTRSSKKKK